MKKDNVGILILLLGVISFVTPMLIKFYQEDILLGITITGGFMIAIGLIMILTRKVKQDDSTETD